MVTTQTDLIAIHVHLDDYPTDWTTRLIMADLYEERGEQLLADFQRWLALVKKAPQDSKRGQYPFAGTRSRGRWYWWSNCDNHPSCLGVASTSIHLTPPDDTNHTMNYATRHQAETALFEVYCQLGEITLTSRIPHDE